MPMSERDEMTVVNLVCGLIEVASHLDKPTVMRALGRPVEAWPEFDWHALTIDEKMTVSEAILDEYSYGELTPNTRAMFRDHLFDIHTNTP